MRTNLPKIGIAGAETCKAGEWLPVLKPSLLDGIVKEHESNSHSRVFPKITHLDACFRAFCCPLSPSRALRMAENEKAVVFR